MPPSTAGFWWTACLLKRDRVHKYSSRSLHLSIGKQFVIAIPTCLLPARTPRGPDGSVLPPVHLAALREGGEAYKGSSRTLGSPCMNAFSPSANVPSDVVDARICSVMLMDDSSGVGQLRSISWMSGSPKPCTHNLALALYRVSVSFQRRTRREEITRSRCFFLLSHPLAWSL